MKKQTSVFENSLIWFGAGVSIAEILTGTYFAPLGFEKGILAVIIGHIIGCAMLFCAGLIGGKCRKSSMETVKMSFGNKGGLLFSVLNVIQLVGWTAIMIYDGSLSVNSILNMGDTGRWIACIVIGALIVLLDSCRHFKPRQAQHNRNGGTVHSHNRDVFSLFSETATVWVRQAMTQCHSVRQLSFR